jgi:D-alanine transfer protein
MGNKIRFFELFIFPFLIALIFVFILLFFSDLKSLVYSDQRNEIKHIIPQKKYGYYPTLSSGLQAELEIIYGLKNKTIVIYGSSELTHEDFKSIPYRFIPESYNYPVLAIGHEGNQSLSILSQMLANYKFLKDANIVIIISANWFNEYYAKGTSLDCFLEYNHDRYLNSICQNHNIPDNQKSIIYSYVGENYFEINNPSQCMQLMYIKNAKDNFLSYYFNPVYKINELFFNSKMFISKLIDKLLNTHNSYIPFNYDIYDCKAEAPVIKNTKINWDSLFKQSIAFQKSISTNNQWGVENNYFKNAVKGEKKRINFVPPEKNIELTNFLQLVECIKKSGCHASFIMQPLNPNVYCNLKDFSDIKSIIDSAVISTKMPYLDLFVTEPKDYQIGTLTDIMHLGDYGWYQIDSFIVNKYIPKEIKYK